MGRRYLPANWFESVVSAEQIAAAETDCQQSVAQAIDQLLQLSEHYYASALAGIRLLPFRSRLNRYCPACLPPD